MEIISKFREQQYQPIPSNTNTQQSSQIKKYLKYIPLILLLYFAYLSTKLVLQQNSPKVLKTHNVILPSGVNLGSWLSLEDYFFAGKGSVEVATPTNYSAGTCLPPLHIGPSTGPRWNSETDLLSNLWKTTSLANALRVFHAHRTSFLDFDEDLGRLSKLGIGNVRVPLSWCLTDADVGLLRDETAESLLKDKFTCKDPFYDVYWPAVPKSLLLNFLEKCREYGIKAVIDIHTYPGATSIGTFSGLWPKWPKFWTDGDLKEPDLGRNALKNIIMWVESLHESNPKAFEGIRAISIMNEPAHLMGLFNGPNATVVDPSQPPFVPPLPQEISIPFLNKINTKSPTNTIMPDGEHLRIFYWLYDGINTFRQSKLPSLGIECHVNIIESIFAPVYVKADGANDMKERTKYIASFWRTATNEKERNTWAILDYHRYHAWDPNCQGASDGIYGNYTCSDTNARTKTLKKCTQWAKLYRTTIDKECGKGTRLASAEFSSSTHHSVRHACQDVSTLQATYKAQTETAAEFNIELFYWAYQMPYGGAFRNAWSFKQLMYLMGVWDRPDERVYDCGEHVVTEDEPHDLSFGS